MFDLEAYLARERLDLRSFFRSAYIWKFGKDANVERDVLQYKIAGITPRYVAEYVQHIRA
jgi:hypothetical protein